MARQTDAIKECLRKSHFDQFAEFRIVHRLSAFLNMHYIEFKGPPDPLRGDEIYKRVRDMAKEALDAIFDSQPSVPVSAVASKIQGTMTFF